MEIKCIPQKTDSSITIGQSHETYKLHNNYSFSIVKSIDEISGFWDVLTYDEIFMQSKYHKVLESVPFAGIDYRYCLVQMNDENVGIIYMQLKKYQLSDTLNFHSHDNDTLFTKVNQTVKKISASLIKGHLLVVGNVSLTGDFGYRFCETVDHADHPKIVHGVVTTVVKLLKEKGKKVNAVLIKDFQNQEHRNNPEWKEKFGQIEFEPAMELSIPSHWHSFDDYLSDLKSKARVRVKRAKKMAASLDVRLLTLEEISIHSDTIYKLYLKIASYSSFNLFILGKEYFYELKKNLIEDVKIFGVFDKGSLVAFFTMVDNKHEIHGHFLGYDQSYNASHQIYLNMLFWMVEETIKWKAQKLELSRTALEIKSSIGAEPLDLSILTYSPQKLTNKILKQLVDIFTPKLDWVPRNPFKDQQEA